MSLDSLKPDGIIILDFGGQYAHLIARRVRELNVYSEIVYSDSSPKEIQDKGEEIKIKGIILSGSPASVATQEVPFNPDVLDMGIPVLGLCYGHQLLAKLLGGTVISREAKEYGATEAVIDRPIDILKGMDTIEKVWMSHGDTVTSVPPDFEILAHTGNSPVAAFKHGERPLWGLQWHPEVVHTEKGMLTFRNFVFDICGCEANWYSTDLIEIARQEIEETIGDGRAIIALSGGVDSSVAAALVGSILGEGLIAVHVDHGFMRLNESEEVVKTFTEMGVDVQLVLAQDRFMERLDGVEDPEEKRKIIGEEFIRVFEEKAREAKADYLIQGTIYPDRIESGISRHADRIKTHHNVGGLPLELEFKAIIEPLRNLYKDEVRELGEKLGLPESIVKRQPFPGPGLAVRIMGEVTSAKLALLKQADAIVVEEVQAAKMEKYVWQYFAVLTDTKSTGVKGDERSYGHTIAIRIVESIDGMTANFSKPSWAVLENISNRIGNEILGVTRVVYDITNKPPATIEWE
jgi:GMP synthase (glutamine-hydrolysing)